MKVGIDDGGVGANGDPVADDDRASGAEHTAGHGEVPADLEDGAWLPGADYNAVVRAERVGAQGRAQAEPGTERDRRATVFEQQGSAIEFPTRPPGDAVQGEEGAQVGVDQPATELVMQFPGGVD